MKIGPLETFKVIEGDNHISVISTRNHMPDCVAHILGTAKDCGIFVRRYLGERQQGKTQDEARVAALMGSISVIKP